MGLLTDPRTENMKLIKFTLKWEKYLTFLMYIGGIVWTILLATPTFSDNTYFSENALLPGLVTKESNLMHASKLFHQELIRELERQRGDQIPSSWLAARFRQLHLDTFVHNFTLIHPFRNQKFTGKNVYGIVRAPRGVSTEAIVVNVPYRPLNSVHSATTPSIALLFAFAQFCRKQKYWAKDIIFLVTEHEQLGVQAWLDAYHGVTSGQDDVLLAGDLSGRAGAIQAAIVLEMHAMKVTSIDVKVEGLNGQLPNLDLFNLAQNMIYKEDIRRTVQRRFDFKSDNKFDKWLYRGKTMTSMIMSQATGVPTGNHGLFHRFGIEAITLEGFEKTTNGPEASFSKVGRVIESIIRSLNNLLERFHQSYFFYLLPSTDRYVSIGIYTLPFILMIATLFIKAFSIWLRLQDIGDKKKEDKKEKKKDKQDKNDPEEFDIEFVAMEFLWTHTLGFLLMSSPRWLISTTTEFFKWQTETATYLVLAMITIFTVLCPFLTPRRKGNFSSSALVCVIACVELGTALMCVEIHNFSLALLIAVVYVPMTLLIPSEKDSMKKGFYKLLYVLWPLLHPFAISSFIVTVYTYANFMEETTLTILFRGWKATKQAFVLSIIDSTIYGNWLYSFIVSIMLPIWLLFWNIIHSS